MVTGIEHIAIASVNPLRLAQWYVDHLGFRINYRPPNSNTVFVRASDGSMLEIIQSNAPAAAPATMKGPGLRHLALAVTDFDKILAHLKSKSVKFLTEREDWPGCSIIFFADCDGNTLHLVQREKPLP
jgi:glyoxylase I family protein